MQLHAIQIAFVGLATTAFLLIKMEATTSAVSTVPIIVVIHPGKAIRKPPTTSRGRDHGLSKPTLRRYPSRPEAIIHIPNRQRIKRYIISSGEPCRIKAGLKTKKNGRKYSTMASREAVQAVFIGLDLARAAPINAM